MEINTTRLDDGGVILKIKGKLTAAEEGAFQGTINESVAETNNLTLDLEGVYYISSSGLRTLVSAKKQIDAKGGVLSVINVCKDVRDVFEITGLGDLFGLQ
ncbi:MAG: STAS domain-containing protein [Endomicrobium sp.]|jgi:anti-sigma B factor antagonist|nr:STAS domain-containing protein [Endomicrobium sp.]